MLLQIDEPKSLFNNYTAAVNQEKGLEIQIGSQLELVVNINKVLCLLS